MDDQLGTASQEALHAVARRIEAHAHAADQETIEAALLLRDLRRRIEAGEAGDVKWYAWARENIQLGQTRVRELQRIAEAEDPQAEIESLRRRIRERVERHRAAAERRRVEAVKEVDADLEDERARLIAWAREAPLEDVRRILEAATDRPHQVAGAAAGTPELRAVS